MKVVHIGFQYGLNNTGGAAIAATRLHLALLKAGVESHYVCVHQLEQGQNVHVLPRHGVARFAYSILTKLMRCIWKFTSYRKSICLNLIPMFGLEKLLANIKPDVVHVQWINADVCSFEQLSKLPYRLVFNLHDLYMLNAIEPYPGIDRRYQEGFTTNNSTSLERWLLTRRKELVEKKHPVFIGPSEWVCKMCRASVVGRGRDAFAIPNIIESCFRYDPLLRKPHEKMVMLFGAYGGRSGKNKGWKDCEISLKQLPREMGEVVEVHVFGEMSTDYNIDGISIRFLGNISDSKTLVSTYHSADIFLFPSIQETQGMTKVEAMLCGLPVIAFNRTACAEGIEHGVTGWIATDGDYVGFSEGMKHYIRLFMRKELSILHEEVARCAFSLFSEDNLIKKIRTQYEKCLEC